MEFNLSDRFKKFLGVVEEGVSDTKAIGKAIKTDLNILGTPEWDSHAYIDQTITKPHMKEWAGGYNRKSRNASSFYGGYDAAMRWPDQTEELKTLSKGYQMFDAVTSIGKKGGDLKNEMQDALANISGIEAAERDIKEGKKYTLGENFNTEIAATAKQWAETYTNKE